MFPGLLFLSFSQPSNSTRLNLEAQELPSPVWQHRGVETWAGGAGGTVPRAVTAVPSGRQGVDAPVTCSGDQRFKPPPKHSFGAPERHEEGSGTWVQTCGVEDARGRRSRGGKGSRSDAGEVLEEWLPRDLHLEAAQEGWESGTGCVGTPGMETLPFVQP